MEELVDLAIKVAIEAGADYAEARFQSNVSRFYLVRNGNPEAVGETKRAGIGVRVLVGGAMGFASINKPDADLVRERVRDAVSMARASSRLLKEPIRFSEEEAPEDSYAVKPKIPAEDVPMEEKMELLMDVDRRVASPREVGVSVPQRLFQLSEKVEEKYYANSEGARIRSTVPRVYFTGFLTAHEGGAGTEQESIEKGESRGWEAVREWNLVDYVAERATTLGRILREAEKPPKGKVDVVLGSLVVGLMVHESAGHPYEADRIFGREAAQAGESFLTVDMLGRRIGAEVVSVADDPTIPNSYGYYLYDDEGVKARRRLLIKNGVINEFLHNRETAARMGVRSNASARAEFFDREPIIRMANTFMLPGDHTLEELLEGVKLGVYIRTFGEWNIDDRRYNMRFVGTESYLIKNGELGGFVRRPVLEITTPGFYGSIDAVGRELRFEAATCGKGDPVQGVPVWHGGPDVRVRGVEVWR